MLIDTTVHSSSSLLVIWEVVMNCYEIVLLVTSVVLGAKQNVFAYSVKEYNFSVEKQWKLFMSMFTKHNHELNDESFFLSFCNQDIYLFSRRRVDQADTGKIWSTLPTSTGTKDVLPNLSCCRSYAQADPTSHTQRFEGEHIKACG